MRTMFVDCKSCGTRFDWVISQEEPVCQRCQTLQGSDIREILKIMNEVNVPGQKNILRVLKLLTDRVEAAESALEAKGKAGFFK